MDSTRRTSFITGVLFIITFVTSIPAALVLYTPVLDDANYILGAGADTRVAWGAFLEVLLIIANIGTAVVLFPILKRQNEPLALGYVSARRRGTVLDRVILMGTILGATAPIFATGMFVSYIFGIPLGWLPFLGAGSGGLDTLRHLILPAVTLALQSAARLTRLVRAGDGYRSVAEWRPSNSGKPIGRRRLLLSIDPKGIVDYGDGDVEIVVVTDD